MPGVLEVFDRIDNARAIQLPDLSQLSSDADLSAAQEILDEAAFALQDELTLFAIEHYGANALLSFVIEGPLPVQDEELIAQGYVRGGNPVGPFPRADMVLLLLSVAVRARSVRSSSFDPHNRRPSIRHQHKVKA